MVNSRTSVFLILIISSILLFPHCSNDDDSLAPSRVALDYINEFLDIMENNSVNKNEIDWPSFRNKVIEFSGTPQSTADTYPALNYAIQLLNDNHSTFFPQSKSQV